jgi:hypothetical protein
MLLLTQEEADNMHFFFLEIKAYYGAIKALLRRYSGAIKALFRRY